MEEGSTIAQNRGGVACRGTFPCSPAGQYFRRDLQIDISSDESSYTSAQTSGINETTWESSRNVQLFRISKNANLIMKAA
jgi:hypothetical protein